MTRRNLKEGVVTDTLIKVYGASWCKDCVRSKNLLNQLNIGYIWTDIEEQPEFLQLLKDLNNGKRVMPTIVFADGSTLSEPSDPELLEKLSSQYDNIIGRLNGDTFFATHP